MSLSTRASAFDIRGVREGRRAGVSGDCLVDVGPGGGGVGVGVEIGVVKNFAETGDAAISAMSTPMPYMCRTEG